MSDLSELPATIANLTTEIDAFQKRFEKKQKLLEDSMGEKFNLLEQKMLTLPARFEHGGSSGDAESVGARFCKAFDLDAYRRSGKLRVDVGSLWTKAITTADFPSRTSGPIAPVAFSAMRVRQLLRSVPIGGSSIEYARMGVYVNAADIVAEGALKPESSVAFSPVTGTFKTVAHWIHASKQVLSDNAQLRELIDTLALWGLEQKVESYLLNDATDGLNTLAPAVAAPSGTPADRIRKAIGQVEVAGWRASAVVLHPDDWEGLETTKDTTGQYLLGGAPQGSPTPQLWSKTVVPTPQQPAGTALVGDFATAATIFDREDATILASDEDRDNFVKNMVTLLCEARLLLAVQVPAAFRKVALA